MLDPGARSGREPPRRIARSALLTLLLTAAMGLSPAAEDSAATAGWKAVPVPESWKSPPGGDGYSWYRCLVLVPERWRGKPLTLFVEPVDDARQVFVNGVPVGASGTFPPLYRSGLGESPRHRVPAERVRAGKENVIAVRVFTSGGRTNFGVAAPVLLAGAEAIRMEGMWAFRRGDDPSWARLESGSPRPPAVFSTVDAVKDIEEYVRRRKGDRPPLPPAEALAAFHVADDLALDLVLSEPVIAQPLDFEFDERGRLWLLEYRQYPNPAGLKMVSRDKYLRTVYDRVPPPPPHHFRGRDRISIHADTDGDGILDSHSVFVDGLSIATSFARGRGGVWVLNPPYFLFYPDADGDDVPDGDPEVILEGFGLEDTHSVVNSLRWGPDGWLYATQGSTVSAKARRPGSKEVARSMGQLVFRYHPETRRYEIFAEGGGNAFGLEIDSKGRIFSGYNGGDTRGFYYVQGAYCRKGFEKHGPLSNPYAFGYFGPMKHHSVPRFTHTFLIYEGDALPEAYRGKLFGVEPIQGQIVLSEITRDGSSFRTKDISRPVTTDEQWFRPVNIGLGPDGAIYIADFHEQRIDHSSHYAGRVASDTGRLYRLRARGEQRRPASLDLGSRSSAELVGLLRHPNRWRRRMALQLLADRRDAKVIPELVRLLAESGGQLALEALWALNLSGGLTEDVALAALDHRDPYVRLWTVRLLCDERDVTSAVARKLAAMAPREPDVDARSQLACSARRLPAPLCLKIVGGLLTHDADAGDIYIPLLLWWAIESKVGAAPDAVLGLLRDPAVWRRPLVEDHLLERLMRRLAAPGKTAGYLACARLLSMAPDREHAEILLRGFEKAAAGRDLRVLPDALVEAIDRAGGGSPALRLRRGDAAEVGRALDRIESGETPLQERLDLVHVLGQIAPASALDRLLGLATAVPDGGGRIDERVRAAALNALLAFSDPRIGEAVTRAYSKLSADAREVARNLLAARKPWALALIAACEAGTIDPAGIPAAVARKMLLHDDDRIRAGVRKLWGDISGATTAAMRARIDELRGLILRGSGNPYPGERLFASKCGKCHRLFGSGGDIGPDLTPYQRKDLERILLNVVNPSAEIREGYENNLVITRDGRIVNGFIADRNESVVIVRGADGENVVIERGKVVSMQAVPQSLMPEGLLDDLSGQEIRDLFAYLRSSQPLP